MKRLPFLAVALLAASCGSDDGGTSSCSEGCVGHGFFQEVTSSDVSITLNNSDAEQKFAVIPFALGGDDVNGTSDDNIGSVAATASTEGSLRARDTAHSLNFDQFDHMVRRLYNSFDLRGFANNPAPLRHTMQRL